MAESRAHPAHDRDSPSHVRASPDQARAGRWRAGRAGRSALHPAVALVVVLGILLVVAAGALLLERQRAAARVRQLHAADPMLRREAAWALAERPNRRGELELARILDRDSEPVADVREALVHALGEIRVAGHFGAVIRVAELDESGFVRQAAWRAAARIDPARFRDFITDRPAARDAWDRTGLAQARLVIGDVSGVRDLLEIAAQGPDGPRDFAAQALERQVGPLLERVGRWPLAIPARSAGPWPPKVLFELGRRCAEVDLAGLARQAATPDPEAVRLRRDIGRILGGRERLARLLFGQPAEPNTAASGGLPAQ